MDIRGRPLPRPRGARGRDRRPHPARRPDPRLERGRRDHARGRGRPALPRRRRPPPGRRGPVRPAPPGRRPGPRRGLPRVLGAQAPRPDRDGRALDARARPRAAPPRRRRGRVGRARRLDPRAGARPGTRPGPRTSAAPSASARPSTTSPPSAWTPSGAHEQALTARLVDGLAAIDGVRVYAPADPATRIGVVSFTLEGFHPHEVAQYLSDELNVMVRSGHHCCEPLMRRLGLPRRHGPREPPLLLERRRRRDPARGAGGVCPGCLTARPGPVRARRGRRPRARRSSRSRST